MLYRRLRRNSECFVESTCRVLIDTMVCDSVCDGVMVCVCVCV